MILILKNGCPESVMTELTDRMQELGYIVNPIIGVEKTILAGIGGQEHDKVDAIEQLRAHEWIDDVLVITRPFKLVARDYRPESTVIDLGDGVTVGGNDICMMAGPCTVETEDQLMTIAAEVARSGAKVLRGGAYKPSTSPYSFQGLGIEALKMLRHAAQTYGLKVITEVMDPRKVELVSEYADILQVGTRNMQNYDLLREVGLGSRAVMLKRGMSAKIEEWLLAAEYVAAGGNERIILCERGVRTFETATRNTLDLASVPLVKSLSHLPVVIDPSQGTGRRDLVAALSKGAIAVGADGLLIEVHPNPDHALKDGAQSMTIQQYRDLIPALKRIASAVDRGLPLN